MPEFTVQETLKYDPAVLDSCVNLRALEKSVDNYLSDHNVISDVNRMAWALKAMTLTDLTTLAGDDTNSNVERLCFRACYPFALKFEDELSSEDEEFVKKLHVAAVCVYPTKVRDAYECLKKMNMLEHIQIASVATGFPSGLFPLKSRIEEINFAIENGATEIDIVVDRSLVLCHKWDELYAEIAAMRKACGNRAHLKTILGIGECGTMDNVYNASMVAMMAGSDFIKTSTGKESVNATLPVGLVMIRTIQAFYKITGKKIGLKPAGGVRTVDDSIKWMIMIKETLGNEYLQPELFRFGASGLLDDIQKFVLSKINKK